MSLTERIKEYGLGLGHCKVGITTADNFDDHAEELLSRGEVFDFLVDDPRDPIGSTSPEKSLAGAKSIVVMAWDYGQKGYPPSLLEKLGRLYLSRCETPPVDQIDGARFQLMMDFLQKEGCRTAFNSYLPMRRSAARAGVGTFGRNNFLYAGKHGSMVGLSAIIVDCELEYDTPTLTCKCPPDCRKCMDACPTQAIEAPLRLNPQKCLGLLSVKGNMTIPVELRPKLGQRIGGCDVCQEACPRNKRILERKPLLDPFLALIDKDFTLYNCLHMEEEFFQTRVHPLFYNFKLAKKILQKNAAVALGNGGDEESIPHLIRELEHPEPIVRAHVAWALGQFDADAARSALSKRLAFELEPSVKSELELALNV